MTCPGGCIGGGGQPKDREYKGDALRAKRIEGLYKRDDSMQLRLSHENPEIIKLYEEFYGEPLSELAEQMLHTVYLTEVLIWEEFISLRQKFSLQQV